LLCDPGHVMSPFEVSTIECTSSYTAGEMMSQVLSEQSSAVRAFAALIRTHAAVIPQLNAQLTRHHGLRSNDYEVLLRLARAEDGRMRRVDLATEVLPT